MNTHAISIIIPTFNASKTLPKAIESILNQSYQDFELIIIDGLSTDNTIEIAKKYNDSRIKIVSEKDTGIYDAMNKGIQLAEGDWLYFLGSDDSLYDPTVLEKISALFDKDYDVLYGNVVFSISQKIYDGRFSAQKLIARNICHQAIFTHKNVFKKLGNFNVEYKGLADYHFNFKWFSNQTIKHKYIDQIIAYYYEDGYSFNNPDKKFSEDFVKIIKSYMPLSIWMGYKVSSTIKRIIAKVAHE